MKNLSDDNRKLFTVLFQRLEARKTGFPFLGGARPPGTLYLSATGENVPRGHVPPFLIGNRQLFPAGQSEEMFEKNSAGDSVVEGVVGFAARTELADARLELQSGD